VTSQSISLLFGVHAHQPVGNFAEVLVDAHLRCYKPFLQVLYRYPDFKFALHFSGWLLDFLFEHYPDDMDLLRDMVIRGQVELFGAGETEPVLAVIPNRDRIGQIETFSKKLEKRLGRRPQGAWLTERVWESTVVPALVDCGIRYAIVDDYHFICAGKTKAELNGFFTTEEDARTLDLFPISEMLRYKLPFSPAHEAVTYIESLVENSAINKSVAAIYFDDIEKFGIWPETYQWVYEKGWLEQFIQGVLASSKILPRHYRDYHASEKTCGVIYLPTTSYIEMNEWTLPAETANAYADLVYQAKSAGWYEHNKSFLRGGIWKNFFSRYPESNWMHKRMLCLSARFAALPEMQRSDVMRQKLYASQANDAYWHGLFGGLYLPHLRRAIYNNIIELEALLDACAPRPAFFIEDTDLDGVEEAYLHNGILQTVVKLDGGASICEFDAYLLKHNFGDTLHRQIEHYYCGIRLDAHDIPRHSDAGIASAHDRTNFKHHITPSDLEVDNHAQNLFLDSLNGISLIYQLESHDDCRIRFQSNTDQCQIVKEFELAGNRLLASYSLSGNLMGYLETELNLAMPSCDGPGGCYIKGGTTVLGGFGQFLDLADVTDISLEDSALQGTLTLDASVPVRLCARPHFTVSQSEGGYEKIMQAVKLKLIWPTAARQLIIALEVKKG
jgi:4-alpha-glucanotransferase/alpha-amylase